MFYFAAGLLSAVQSHEIAPCALGFCAAELHAHLLKKWCASESPTSKMAWRPIPEAGLLPTCNAARTHA